MTVLGDRRHVTLHGTHAAFTAAPLRAPRPRVAIGRPREPARRRPSGRFVEYRPAPSSGTSPSLFGAGCSVGGAPARRVVCPMPQPQSVARVRIRMFVACSLLAAVLVAVVMGLAALGGPGPHPVPTRTAVVQVHQGESLSSLASRVAPGVATSAVVQRIVELNALSTVSVRVGQALVVPFDE
ncbi:MAG: LysM peptidoglycan-binding domain-containing protein [Mycobacteriaceae bacterium]